MSREKSWQIPGKGAIYVVPQWVEDNCKMVIAKDKIQLQDNSFAVPGDWLILKNGQLTKK